MRPNRPKRFRLQLVIYIYIYIVCIYIYIYIYIYVYIYCKSLYECICARGVYVQYVFVYTFIGIRMYGSWILKSLTQLQYVQYYNRAVYLALGERS